MLKLLVTEMLLAVLSVCSEEELGETDSEGEGDLQALADAAQLGDYQQRREEIKNKVLAVGRMQRVFQILRFVLRLFEFQQALTFT